MSPKYVHSLGSFLNSMFCVMPQGAEGGKQAGTLGSLVLEEGLLNGPPGSFLLDY